MKAIKTSNISINSTSIVDLHDCPRPSRNKREYHGNGDNAWYWTIYTGDFGEIKLQSIRYNYRWHKSIVLHNGRQLLTSADYKRIDNILTKGN
jgi:hypothetical protein